MLARDLVVLLLIAVIATAPAMALEIAPAVDPDRTELQAEGQEAGETEDPDAAAASDTADDEDLENGKLDKDGPDTDEGDDKPVPRNRLEGPAFHRPDTDASRPLETIGGAEPDLPLSRAHAPERVVETPRFSRRPAAVHQVDLRTERRAGLGALPPPNVVALSPQR
ncbi:MAG: hypothetical protein V3T86_13820 [Planctomycetota bacterium]